MKDTELKERTLNEITREKEILEAQRKEEARIAEKNQMLSHLHHRRRELTDDIVNLRETLAKKEARLGEINAVADRREITNEELAKIAYPAIQDGDSGREIRIEMISPRMADLISANMIPPFSIHPLIA